MKDLSKMEGKNQFFEAPETVWWLGPTDPNPWFYDTLLVTVIAVRLWQ